MSLDKEKPSWMSDSQWAEEQRLAALPMSAYGIAQLSARRSIIVKVGGGKRRDALRRAMG